LHTGVGTAQSALVRQATQVLDTVSHLGVAMLVQSASTAQSTHDPAFIPVVSQAGPAGLFVQSALVWQARQVWLVVSHVGVAPLQSVLNSQATHVPLGKSQTDVPPMHAEPLVAEHCPHAPQTSHAGVAPPQFASDAHAWQVPPLHTGVSPPQSAALRHCTQMFVAVQRGVVGGQLALATQTTQSPLFGPVVAHSEVAPLQSVLMVLQARQVSVVLSQMGVGLAQFASVRQPTQALVGTSQIGVAPVQAVWFVAEQIAQMPDEAQAGVAPLHAASCSQSQGTPLVLSSSSRTSCSLISGLVPVAEVKPTYICAPSWVKRLSACAGKIGIAGFVAVCEM